MAVPEEIRKVPRPKNTFVVDSKTGVYSVREKTGCGYYVDENGKTHRPSQNGKVVGHIKDGVYVPKEPEPVPMGDIEVKDWANVELFDRLNKDILSHLYLFYHWEDATRLYVLALLRASYEGIPDYLLARQYQESFLSVMYPRVKLNREPASDFVHRVGRSCLRTFRFMKYEASCVNKHQHLIIDSCRLKGCNGVNSLSEVTKKTAKRESEDVLLMYAYCKEQKRPVCSTVYYDEFTELEALSDFMERFEIHDGIVVADTGSPLISLNETDEDIDVHCLLPIERDSPVVEELSLYRFDEVIRDKKAILCKKTSRTEDGKEVWYYSFGDIELSAEEEEQYLSEHGDHFDGKEFTNARRLFGSTFFQSDLDIPCKTAYEIYADREQVRLFFRSRQNMIGMDGSDFGTDLTAIGNDFVDHLASIMRSNMFGFLSRKRLIEKYTYGEILGILQSIKKTRTSGEEWKVRKLDPADAKILERVGLLNVRTEPKETKKKGRPKGSKDSRPRKKRATAAESEDAPADASR